MNNDGLYKAVIDHGCAIRELVRVKTKLQAARAIASDFRKNTSLDTIIREYESRIKEIEKTMEEQQWTAKTVKSE